MMDTIDERGRVVGPRGARATKKWVPKEWLPIYEAIVALSCTGLSNAAVGERFGYGPQQVSNILNTPQGKKLKQIIADKIRTENTNTVSERVAAIHDKALQRVESVIFDDDRAEAQPLAIFDRSMAILKSGVLKEHAAAPAAGVNIGQAVFMQVTPEARNQLNEGLRKADQVRVIHSGPVGNVEPPKAVEPERVRPAKSISERLVEPFVGESDG